MSALMKAMGNTVYIPVSHHPTRMEPYEAIVPGMMPPTRDQPLTPEEISFGAIGTEMGARY